MAKLPIVAKNIAPNLKPVFAVADLISAWKEYKKIYEVETTKRAYIDAQREITLERIRSQRAIVEQYLGGVFSERKHSIDKMFEELDKGIEKNDDRIMSLAMSGIISTLQTSPLAGLKELSDQLKDPNVDIIDI